MLDPALSLRPSPFEPLVVEAAAYYAITRYKLAHFKPRLSLQQAASSALTTLLLVVSLAGSTELAHLFSEANAHPQAPISQSSRLHAALAAPSKGPTSTPATSGATPKQSAGLTASVPNHIQIPSINVDATLDPVGLNTDGTLEVPFREDAGWYTGSPTPGEVGPAIIDGHVDSIYGIAVFWYLKDLQPGDPILVTRDDGSVVHFTIQRVASYNQNNFPTNEVYGNITYPGLRLITCTGTFDYTTRHYSNNLVVYAKADL